MNLIGRHASRLVTIFKAHISNKTHDYELKKKTNHPIKDKIKIVLSIYQYNLSIYIIIYLSINNKEASFFPHDELMILKIFLNL